MTMKLQPGNYLAFDNMTLADAHQLAIILEQNGIDFPGFPHSYWRSRDGLVIIGTGEEHDGMVARYYQQGYNESLLRTVVEMPRVAPVESYECKHCRSTLIQIMEMASEALGISPEQKT